LAFFKQRAEEMLHFFENHNSRQITGSSILMIVDNVCNGYDMRIIDISSMKDYDDLNERDQGYIVGLKNIIRILN
jgi:hypothetical protein